jgi:hypothetical protein
VREALARGDGYVTIAAGWDAGLAEFARRRAEFLLYR